MKSFKITCRKAGVVRNVRPRLQLASVPHERIHDVAAIAEVIHDAFELPRMLKSDGVAQLVNTRQVNNGLAQKIVLNSAAGEGLSLRRNLRHHENDRARFAVHLNPLGFSIESFIRRNPPDTY